MPSQSSYEKRLAMLEATISLIADDVRWIKTNMIDVLQQHAVDSAIHRRNDAVKAWFAGVFGGLVVAFGQMIVRLWG